MNYLKGHFEKVFGYKPFIIFFKRIYQMNLLYKIYQMKYLNEFSK